jgi:hypothetical protein
MQAGCQQLEGGLGLSILLLGLLGAAELESDVDQHDHPLALASNLNLNIMIRLGVNHWHHDVQVVRT